ncbi:hypothetical protein LCGC14_0615610 [marine sediment metagenome]|uniref:Cytochrome oxidase subunit II copper A binding domain-containing protein n=1 Tax=marine sediment metagenome TaxID=412755 RepID=A0A0F9UEV7_9ZZZZ|nr:hypothetical protein [Phycisphaerae bacterium]HDZ43482.1 hypothetical protein [Phycisphaerae bacterium]
MNRGVVFLIILLTVVVFAGLVQYGWTNRWGGKMDTTVEPPLVLAMPQLDKSLSLDDSDFTDDVWRTLAPLAVPMMHQVTQKPHGQHLVRAVNVRSFHNGKDVYFLFEWKDDAASRVHDIDEFPDGVAVGFPLGGEPPAMSIMMGFQSAVNIWQWKANLDAAVWGGADERFTANTNYLYVPTAGVPTADEPITSACQDLIATRPGTLTPKETTALTGRGQWSDGAWRVIIKRPLTTGDAERDAQVKPGKMHVVFAVWDGSKGDRGSRKSLSEWLILDVKSSESADGAQAGRSLATMDLPMLAAAAPAEKEEPRIIEIQAKRFEYTPSEITLQKNELVTLRLVSMDVAHGLYLDGYDINMNVEAGETTTRTLRADKTGRFSFRCSVTCGPFHPYMIGYMNVEPNTRFHIFVGVAAAAGLIALVSALVMRTKKEAPQND